MELAADAGTGAGPKETPRPDYWGKRQGAVYLAAARRICQLFSPEPSSVIDVGSNGTPTLEWHRADGTRLVSCDLRKPYRADGVESVRGDFLAYDETASFELVTCFQVLEHVPDAGSFAKKLLAVGRTLIVSVPYKWPKGQCKYHVHDPVDDDKMLGWFGRQPTYRYVASEPITGRQRLIHVYAPPDVVVVGTKVTKLEKRKSGKGFARRASGKRSFGVRLKNWLRKRLR
jgi:hypothetical protein